jgi:DMSO/TMAO reductase YedYZ heme-binding membrane subunit
VLASLTWSSTRASGVVAYALLAAGTVWGLALSTRGHGKRPPRPWVLDVHRMLGGLALVMTVLHVTSILLDSFVHFGIVDVLVPFAVGWKSAAVAIGIVAAYLLVAVEVTSLLRQRISNRIWRRVHYSSFAVFVLASGHFIAAGTDAGNPLSVGLLIAALGAVVVLTAYRIARAIDVSAPLPPPAPHERVLSRTR